MTVGMTFKSSIQRPILKAFKGKLRHSHRQLYSITRICARGGGRQWTRLLQYLLRMMLGSAEMAGWTGWLLNNTGGYCERVKSLGWCGRVGSCNQACRGGKGDRGGLRPRFMTALWQQQYYTSTLLLLEDILGNCYSTSMHYYLLHSCTGQLYYNHYLLSAVEARTSHKYRFKCRIMSRVIIIVSRIASRIASHIVSCIRSRIV